MAPEREKISKKVLLDTLLNIVSHERKSKAILFTHKNYEAVILKKDEFESIEKQRINKHM